MEKSKIFPFIKQSALRFVMERRNIEQFRAQRDKIPEYTAACCGDWNFEELSFIGGGIVLKEQAFTLRQATAEDAAAIRALIRQFGINPLGLDWPRFVLAVDATGEMIGCVQLKPHKDGSVELASLAVVAEWQGKGVARTLIEHMLEIHFGVLYLMCRSDLGPLYKKFGFHSIGIEEMPRYFRRIARLAGFLEPLRPTSEGLLVMLREGSSTNG